MILTGAAIKVAGVCMSDTPAMILTGAATFSAGAAMILTGGATFIAPPVRIIAADAIVFAGEFTARAQCCRNVRDEKDGGSV
jgi:hypothetical protein